jgi:hypothetical protein
MFGIVRQMPWVACITCLLMFAFCVDSFAAKPTYAYPEQPSFAEINKADPQHTLLTDGRTGIDGPACIWGAWDAKEVTIDWDFAAVTQVRSIEVTIRHPQPDSPIAHPDTLRLYPEQSDHTFAAIPQIELNIPFEAGALQTIKLTLPDEGISARRLRSVFATNGHQIVLSEVKFGSTDTGMPPGPVEKPKVKSPASAPSNALATTALRYEYPDQLSKADLFKYDPQATLLVDGKASSEGPACVWGTWNVQPLLVDWTSANPVRITSIDVAIAHPDPKTDNSHPKLVKLFGADDNSEFLTIADLSLDIPFQQTPLQKISLPLPGNGIVVARVRTQFESAKFQTVLSEVTFHAVPATREELQAAQAERQQKQPPKLQAVAFPPAPVQSAKAPANSIFGFCGHMIHTDQFFPGKFGAEWKLERTLPFVVDAHAGWVREPLYQPYFAGDDADICKLNDRPVGENRKAIEAYLADYEKYGAKLILATMFTKASDPSFASYMKWVGSLAKRFRCVAAVEMHNEPNLKGFWNESIRDYVDAAREGARIVKLERADVPILVGSFAGWGGAWEHPELVAKGKADADVATVWAREALALGLLDFADGVSAHPYRNSSAPEGGLHIESPTDPDGFQKEIAGFQEILAKHRKSNGAPLKLYFTEIGFSTGTSGHVALGSVERQADYLSRLMLLLLDVRLSGVPLEAVCWYDLKCDGSDASDGEANFGIVDFDGGGVRPAYLACRRINERFGDVAELAKLPGQIESSNAADIVKSFVWQRQSDKTIIVPFWRMNQLQNVDADFPTQLQLRLPSGFTASEVKLIDLSEDRPRSIGFEQNGDVLTTSVNVRARASWLEISTRAGK